METSSIVRKVVLAGSIVGLVYLAEKMRPFDYLFPNEGERAKSYSQNIDPNEVRAHPEEFSGLANIVLRELPKNSAINVVANYSANIADSSKEQMIDAIYSNAKTKYGSIEKIVAKSNEKESFYMCELGFRNLSFGARAKLAAYSALDILGSDIKRPQ